MERLVNDLIFATIAAVFGWAFPEREDDAQWFADQLNARESGVFMLAEALEKIAMMTASLHDHGIGALVPGARPTGG